MTALFLQVEPETWSDDTEQYVGLSQVMQSNSVCCFCRNCNRGNPHKKPKPPIVQISVMVQDL